MLDFIVSSNIDSVILDIEKHVKDTYYLIVAAIKMLDEELVKVAQQVTFETVYAAGLQYGKAKIPFPPEAFKLTMYVRSRNIITKIYTVPIGIGSASASIPISGEGISLTYPEGVPQALGVIEGKTVLEGTLANPIRLAPPRDFLEVWETVLGVLVMQRLGANFPII